MFGRVAELRVGPGLWTDRDRVEDAEGDGKANVEFLRLHNGSHHDLLEKKGEKKRGGSDKEGRIEVRQGATIKLGVSTTVRTHQD